MEVPFSNIDWLNRPPMIEEIASDNEEINNDQEPQVSDVIIFLKEIIFIIKFFKRYFKSISSYKMEGG